jgi:hypothetical protein
MEYERMKERLTGKMIQIRKAEKLPKKAITFPNPGKSIAVTTQTPVVMILDPTLNTAFHFSFDLILSSWTVVSSGFEIDEVNIWDSSPGKEGFMESIDSIVTFNYPSVLVLPPFLENAENWEVEAGKEGDDGESL